jgi:hypothetical protein
MMSAQRHRLALREARASRLALLALVALLSSLFVGVFVHTDDGCAVESHCQACLFALHHADRPVAPNVAPPVSRVTELSLPLSPGSISGEARIHASRGPPSA